MYARMFLSLGLLMLLTAPASALAPPASTGSEQPDVGGDPGGPPEDARFYSGSDGSDGAFNPLTDVEIDLALAATAPWDTPSPVPGQGVYDPDQWAVVYKFTTIDIPADVTVTFKQHPSGAPVVWLASGDVNIDGWVNLDGEDGAWYTEPPGLAEPGPGGFAGGRRAAYEHGLKPTAGGGPGGPNLVASIFGARGGGYGTVGGGSTGGGTYGNVSILPSIGGSGGTTGDTSSSQCGDNGAGGGAILIAATGEIVLNTNGGISACGGRPAGYMGGGGSGGGIRLLADTISGGGALRAYGGVCQGCPADARTANGGAGRIRIGAYDFSGLTDPGDPNWIAGPPGPIFPPSDAPTLRATLVDTVSVPADPEAGIMTADLEISSSSVVTVEIEATNIPAGTTVNVIVTPHNGPKGTYTSTPLVDIGGGVLTATAEVSRFQAGRSEVYLRANWTPSP